MRIMLVVDLCTIGAFLSRDHIGIIVLGKIGSSETFRQYWRETDLLRLVLEGKNIVCCSTRTWYIVWSDKFETEPK